MNSVTMCDMICPLCHSEEVVSDLEFSVSKVIEEWKENFDTDVSSSFLGADHFLLCRCLNCAVEFFPGGFSGDAMFYKSLQRFSWYYMADKWEYDVALSDVPKGAQVFEVGCGEGFFLKKVIEECDAKASGIELNPDAVLVARRNGLQVDVKSLAEVVERDTGKFDVVCCFQVLEHLENPFEFIESALKLLNTNGRLLISVPDSNGFIRRGSDILNRPPHHLTRWSSNTLRGMEAVFPFSLNKLLYEPLALYHLEWYINLQLDRLPWITYVTDPFVVIVRKMFMPFLRATRLYRFLRGHSIYCCYQKHS